MQILRAATEVDVVIGPFVDVDDGFTPETSVTLSNAAGNDASVFKHENATSVDISGRTWAALTNGDGYYNLTLTTSDTDTAGTLSVIVTDGDVHLPVWKDFQVLDDGAYDAFYGSASSIIVGSVTDSSPTATNFETGTSLTGQGYSNNDQLIGRVLIFDSDTPTTAALKGQAGVISDFIGTAGEVVVAGSTFTTPPATGDTFKIY